MTWFFSRRCLNPKQFKYKYIFVPKLNKVILVPKANQVVIVLKGNVFYTVHHVFKGPPNCILKFMVDTLKASSNFNWLRCGLLASATCAAHLCFLLSVEWMNLQRKLLDHIGGRSKRCRLLKSFAAAPVPMQPIYSIWRKHNKKNEFRKLQKLFHANEISGTYWKQKTGGGAEGVYPLWFICEVWQWLQAALLLFYSALDLMKNC